ncbi:hypothetical protein LX36DRAFT_660119 [Colletotrichum falcatum]|nr:hypothetical protein LX36DRAFT_660119 [Colletotrichum falcatum]
MPSDSEASDASGASTDTLWSCITVAVLLEDLLATCTSDCTLERCDPSMVWPYEPPAKSSKPRTFIPFKVTGCNPEVSELPPTLIDLFF